MKEPSILVVAAVREEIGPFRAVCGGRVKILRTGMGSRRAAESVRGELARRRYAWVISTGFAGGARPGLGVGDLVLASEVVDCASGKRFHPSFQRAVQGSSAGDPALPDCSVGPFVTIQRILAGPWNKETLGMTYGAVAVDMESSAVAAEAARAGVPWSALRAILDPMETPLEIGSVGQGIRMLAHPARWRELARFLEAVRSAGRSLSIGLEQLVSTINNGTVSKSAGFTGQPGTPGNGTPSEEKARWI